MSLEVILWFLAFIVVWEIVYIVLLNEGDKKENAKNWFDHKMMGLFCAFMFILFHLLIVFSSGSGFHSHYNRLIWELGIVGGIIIFFGFNKSLADWLAGGKKKRK